MRVTPTIAALVLTLVGSNSAYAQYWSYGPPAPIYVNPAPYYAPPQGVVAPPPVVVAPAARPVVVAPPAYYAAPPVIVNPYTGRWCTIEPSGYRWCWTP
jgi:hypothetical protein